MPTFADIVKITELKLSKLTEVSPFLMSFRQEAERRVILESN